MKSVSEYSENRRQPDVVCNRRYLDSGCLLCYAAGCWIDDSTEKQELNHLRLGKTGVGGRCSRVNQETMIHAALVKLEIAFYRSGCSHVVLRRKTHLGRRSAAGQGEHER